MLKEIYKKMKDKKQKLDKTLDERPVKYLSGVVKQAQQQSDHVQTMDMVNHPPHYTTSDGVECIEAIKAATGDGYEYYLQGVVLKYIWRYKHKNNGLEDLKKAEWYLSEMIDVVGNDKT
tara:strand:- start:178 stop:534 length:357 start_codon:yes stop_codon:yes gene_type:complete